MNSNMNMEDITSSENGNLTSKKIIGEESKMTAIVYPRRDYGDLPSKTFVDLGKQSIGTDNLDDFLL